MKNIGVFLGANQGKNNAYKNNTIALAHEIGKRNLNIVYGGSTFGLMGDFANAAIKNGSDVFGVITKDIANIEEPHQHLKELYIVNSMQERKAKMFDLSDAFLILPGGFGTLEELFEVWNALKIGLHKKPIGILNIDGYFNKLFDFLNYAASESFIKKEKINLVTISDSPIALLNELISSATKNSI